jgi:hypothetical protein
LPVDYELQKTLISKEIKERKKKTNAHCTCACVYNIVNDWMASDYWTTDIPVKKKRANLKKTPTI